MIRRDNVSLLALTSFTSRANFSALLFPNHRNNLYDDNPEQYEDGDYDDTYPDINAPSLSSAPDTLNIMYTNTSSQAAIAATFRGYCCELFILGKCSKQNAHSEAAQER